MRNNRKRASDLCQKYPLERIVILVNIIDYCTLVNVVGAGKR